MFVTQWNEALDWVSPIDRDEFEEELQKYLKDRNREEGTENASLRDLWEIVHVIFGKKGIYPNKGKWKLYNDVLNPLMRQKKAEQST